MNDNKTSEIVSFLKLNGFDVSLTPYTIVISKGRKLTFDLENRLLIITKKFPWKTNSEYSFDNMDGFELFTSEQYADATPFEDGNKEYIHTIVLNLTNKKRLRLLGFVARDMDGEKKLSALLAYLTKIIV